MLLSEVRVCRECGRSFDRSACDSVGGIRCSRECQLKKLRELYRRVLA